MVLRPHGDLRRDIKAVRGTARYEMLSSGHLTGTRVPARTRGKGAFVMDGGGEQGLHSCRQTPTTLAASTL